jgi:hypothetical protein
MLDQHIYTLIFFFFQSAKGQRYRFSVIVNELKKTESASYKATCLSFINSIIIACQQFDERIRIRNEFIGEFYRTMLNNIFFSIVVFLYQRQGIIYCKYQVFVDTSVFHF